MMVASYRSAESTQTRDDNMKKKTQMHERGCGEGAVNPLLRPRGRPERYGVRGAIQKKWILVNVKYLFWANTRQVCSK